MTEHLDNFLDTKSIHINVADYTKQNLITSNCPVHRIHVGQLGANNPIEDRWNCCFIKDGESISKAVFTIIDGHSGSACSHALAWICLEYIAASLIDTKNAIDILQRLSSSEDVADNANWITEQPTLFNNKGKNVTKRFLKNRLPPLEVRQFLIERLIKYMDDIKLSQVPDEEFCFVFIPKVDCYL
ncbi:unnamed protein product [Rodentolepis nana]|uniref:PPM-type phosphatase domain-containing protein n=1 Tax=Rodentolepis nana TaxID=102285 RepID=A0A0R3TY38_RODNA|nr:unnamed protein product [Rodentolepis nana]